MENAIYYRRRPPQKGGLRFFVLLLLAAGIIALAVSGLRTLWSSFTGEDADALSEKVLLSIEAGSAKAMTIGRSEWQNVPDKVSLYRGEQLKTNADGRASLTFFEKSIVRLAEGSEVSFAELQKKKETNRIALQLKKGSLWAKVERMNNPDSRFTVETDLLSVDSQGGVLAVEAPGTVYMVKGTAQVGVKNKDEVVRTFSLGVGQEFMADEKKIGELLAGQDAEVIFALGDAFKDGDWYRWNVQKDGAVTAFEESTPTPAAATEKPTAAPAETSIAPNRLVYVTSPSPQSFTNRSAITVEGNYDPANVKAVYAGTLKATLASDGQWKVVGVPLALEGENSINLSAEGIDGKAIALDPLLITLDKTAPAAPVVETPASVGGKTIEIESPEQIISGKVSADTEAVIVNDYRLGKYVPGSKTFQYYAKVSYGNLQAGDNEFRILAEDKAGNQSEPAVITLILSEENAKKGVSAETSTGGSLPKAVSSGGVTIASPNGGQSFQTSETSFDLSGSVPFATAKVVVNDYQLSAYVAGSTLWKYKAASTLGNLKIGQVNVYTIKAYDAAGELLGSASFAIDVESADSAAPVITLPTDKSSYTTTLDELVIGGTVGKWTQSVFLNDRKIGDYIPGSESWKIAVKLKAGENVYRVYGERDGKNTPEDVLTVTYQP